MDMKTSILMKLRIASLLSLINELHLITYYVIILARIVHTLPL